MPVDPRLVDGFLGHPAPGSKDVKVSSEPRHAYGFFYDGSIPIDLRSYLFYGDTILQSGIRIMTRFEIDTRLPTLLTGEGLWYIGERWNYPFEPEALARLGVAPEQARPFSWAPYVPIEIIEQPPFQAGQVLHGRAGAAPSIASRRSRSGEKVGGGTLVRIDLEAREKVLFSFDARRVQGTRNGKLFFTTHRALYCPHTAEKAANAASFNVGRREIVDAGCKSVEAPDSPTGLMWLVFAVLLHARFPPEMRGKSKKMCLRLVLVGGREDIFVVDDVVQAIEKLGQWIHPLRG
jgi:hypothetical protein